jgi:hypothetical protein
MTDVLSSMYPSAAPAAAVSAAPAAPQAASAPAATAKPAEAAPPPTATESPGTAGGAALLYNNRLMVGRDGKIAPEEPAPATATPAQAQPPAEGGDPQPEPLPEVLETNNAVRWSEPAAEAATHAAMIDEVNPVPAEPDVFDARDRAAGAAAFEQLGVGATVARELYQDMATAMATPYQGTPDGAMVALTRLWGDQVNTKITTAQKAIDEFAAAYPGLKDLLVRSNLGNDPAFIRKVVAAAEARARRK